MSFLHLLEESELKHTVHKIISLKWFNFWKSIDVLGLVTTQWFSAVKINVRA